MGLQAFHPEVSRWFIETFGVPTNLQTQGWSSVQAGDPTLMAAPTGSGKTLAAFLWSIDDLVRRGLRGELNDQTYVLYISPLKALSNDIEKNLALPLSGIAQRFRDHGVQLPEIRTAVRTGDTQASERARATRKPPHIFVTTPESLFILLTSESGRRMLKSTRTVIIDEIHALARDKRGAHLALSLERLQHLADHPIQRIGLSATQKPITHIAHFMVGTDGNGTPRACAIVDEGHRRHMDVEIHMPSSPLETVMSEQVWAELYDALTSYILQHKTTLVFVNTRRLAERVAKNLSERLSKEEVTSHHGSLSREQRLSAEKKLKEGKLKALVATASLELGIDIGDVDLVCQIGSTRSIATFLQRVGRAGHGVGRVPKGRLFPLSVDELVECTALLDAVRRGELDAVVMPEQPLDILAQQIVAMTAAEDWHQHELFQLVRCAWPYRELQNEAFVSILQMLTEGFRGSAGRRGAYVHPDGVYGMVRGRKGARLAAITSGGAIPDTADYEVVLEPSSTRIGTVNEDFAIESMAGDIFQLGNMSYQILQVLPGTVRVADAQGKPPTIPFWIGEAPNRTDELSYAVARLREELVQAFKQGRRRALDFLISEVGVSSAAAETVCDYVDAAHRALGAMPSHTTLVVERFFDETGNMHVVLHAPLGARIMRAWGLALRKRFCRSFNFELQAAATDDALVLSLGPTHSFPVEDVFRFLHSKTAKDVLTQALLDAPMFETRWRWNASRALALLRFRGGKKVPPRIQRIQAQDLLAVAFPDQQACLENIQGERTIPDHPLVQETIKDCLTEAMDVDRFIQVLDAIERGEVKCIARDVTEPSPFAQAILNAKPYAFLDDAPLEERRTQAVIGRRWRDPKTTGDLGALDQAAIERVQRECWPDPATKEELHDVLYMHGALTENEATQYGWKEMLCTLESEGRAQSLDRDGGRKVWVAMERLPLWQAVGSDDSALVKLMRARLEIQGPTTVEAFAQMWGLGFAEVESALCTLEREGCVFRGRFTDAETEEWCDRRLLARIHQSTLNRLRKEIEPVSAQDFLRFLFRWQHVDPNYHKAGTEGLREVIAQLQGYEIAASAWETHVLAARLPGYQPEWLDSLCLSGAVVWAKRVKVSDPVGLTNGPLRSTPILITPRECIDVWRIQSSCALTENSIAHDVLSFLQQKGASFYDDLRRSIGLLPAQLDQALGELVAKGAVCSDSFAGLRALITPRDHRGSSRSSGFRHRAAYVIQSAGRWNVLPSPVSEATDVEHIAKALLQRWGVMFRRLIDRESHMPPWRDLLSVYRMLESRGEIRGGRFVSGFSGEQYALPSAVEMLRAVRRADKTQLLVAVSGSDPLNLVGLLTPGERVSSIATNRVIYCDGIPAAIRESGKTRFLESPWTGSAWELERALTLHSVAPKVRAYAPM